MLRSTHALALLQVRCTTVGTKINFIPQYRLSTTPTLSCTLTNRQILIYMLHDCHLTHFVTVMRLGPIAFTRPRHF